MPKLTSKRLLVVHAHPDDESIYTAHLIAQTVQAGGEVLVLTLTRGEKGKTQDPDLISLNSDESAMADYRENELRNATSVLGAEFRILGARAYQDSGMRFNFLGKPSKPRRLEEQSLFAASLKVISEELVAVLKEFRPDAVVSYNSKGGFGHPDHRATHHATMLALRQFRPKGRPPKFWVIAEPGEKFDFEVSGKATADLKRAALACHRSQIVIQGDEYSYSSDESHRFDSEERFRLSNIRPTVALRPILSYIWAPPLGVVVAVAGTLLHQTSLANGLAIGLWLALLMVGSLALSLRLLRNSRGALYLTSTALAVTIFWLTQNQVTGEVLIPANESGLIWAYGAIAACFLVILFPNLAGRSWSAKIPK